MELEMINLELELKFATKKKLNPQINLPFNFLILKYLELINLMWNWSNEIEWN